MPSICGKDDEQLCYFVAGVEQMVLQSIIRDVPVLDPLNVEKTDSISLAVFIEIKRSTVFFLSNVVTNCFASTASNCSVA